MAADISSLLLKQLGGKGDSLSKDEASALPEALRKLANAIATDKNFREEISRKEMTAAEKRQAAADAVERQYLADLKETARLMKELNAIEFNSLKIAEKEARTGAAYRQRAEAANKRAEKLSAVDTRQSGERQGNLLNLIGAIGGKGLQGIVSGFVNANAKTAEDVAKISEARYEDRVTLAKEAKEDKFAAADKATADADMALSAAKRKYAAAMAKAAELEGGAALKMRSSGDTLSVVEKAESDLKAARATQRTVAAEGEARLRAAYDGASPANVPAASMPAGNASSAISAPLSDIATAIREGTEKNSGLILDAATKDTIQKERISEVEKDVIERNLAADRAVSEAGAAYAALVTPQRPGEGSKESKALLEYAEGGGMVSEASRIRETAEAEYAAAVAANKAGKENADTMRGEAARAEEGAVSEAFARKQEGSLVSAEKALAVGNANMMNMAIAPPAVVLIGKVMERFSNLFPVIEQTGGALVEMATAVPATLITLQNELSAKLIFLGSQVADAIRFTDNELRERYEESDRRVRAETKDVYGKSMSRADLFGMQQGIRVNEEKTAATRVAPRAASYGAATAKYSPARASQPASFTVENIPGTSSGIAHQASAPIRTPSPETRAAPAPARIQEQSVGVVPVSASNANVDNWR